MLRSPGLHWAAGDAVLLSLGGPRVGPGAAAGLAGKLPGVCSNECFIILTSIYNDVSQYSENLLRHYANGILT